MALLDLQVGRHRGGVRWSLPIEWQWVFSFAAYTQEEFAPAVRKYREHRRGLVPRVG